MNDPSRDDDEKTGWVTIIYMDGDNADEPLNMLLRKTGGFIYQGATDKSVKKTLDYLKQWEDGDWFGLEPEPQWGPADTTIETEGYVIAYNSGLGYISLNRKVSAQ